MPEEYKSLARFADIVEQLMQERRDAARELYLQKRESVRETLDPTLFALPLDVLAVSQEILDNIESFENIGEVMLNCLVDESLVRRKLTVPEEQEDADPNGGTASCARHNYGLRPAAAAGGSDLD